MLQQIKLVPHLLVLRHITALDPPRENDAFKAQIYPRDGQRWIVYAFRRQGFC
jgi:hypothetical protein